MTSTGFENRRLRALIWIVRMLQRGRAMSLEQLNDKWVDEIEMSGGVEIERRTFRNYLNAIYELFGITIECDRRNDYKYRIVEDESSPVIEHMMDNFEQNLALGNAVELADRILVDRAPRGNEHLQKIIRAMKKSRDITIVFQDFCDDEAWEVTGSPYCVKLYQQRWYVVIRDEEGYIDSYSLDRVLHVRVEKTKFQMDPSFSGEDFFRYSFGVRVNPEVEPMQLQLKVSSAQRGYFRSLPLHHSQQEVEITPEYSIFIYEVVPTWELISKIFSYGDLVEVLAPKEYRQMVMEEVAALYHKYF